MNVIETDWDWKSVLSERRGTSVIVLHHAAAKTCTAEQIDMWHKNNGWSGIGYHFFIRKNGEIYRGRPIWAVGAHAQGTNLNSVGVCVEGDYSTETTMPSPQKTALKSVLKFLKEMYPEADIKAHKDVGATGCPGAYYPFEEMKKYFEEVEGGLMIMTQYDELSAWNKKQDEIINLVGQEIEELKTKTKYYNSLEEVPVWYRSTVSKLTEAGVLTGDEDGNLTLTTDMMRILTVLDRLGIIK